MAKDGVVIPFPGAPSGPSSGPGAAEDFFALFHDEWARSRITAWYCGRPGKRNLGPCEHCKAPHHAHRRYGKPFAFGFVGGIQALAKQIGFTPSPLPAPAPRCETCGAPYDVCKVEHCPEAARRRTARPSAPSTAAQPRGSGAAAGTQPQRAAPPVGHHPLRPQVPPSAAAPPTAPAPKPAPTQAKDQTCACRPPYPETTPEGICKGCGFEVMPF